MLNRFSCCSITVMSCQTSYLNDNVIGNQGSINVRNYFKLNEYLFKFSFLNLL